MLRDKKEIFTITFFFIIVFLLLLPVSLSINYWQNDEWVYYPAVAEMLKMNLQLSSLMAPTFYSVGILAAIFSFFFSTELIPALTLFISVLCIFVLCLIIYLNFEYKVMVSILLSLLILVNPFFIFTTWGFMTDNYFLLYLLISILFLLKFDKQKKSYSRSNYLWFLLGNLFIFISYLARQLGLITALAFALWLLWQKKYKEGLIQLTIFLLLAIFHFFIFPKTDEMIETKFVFSNLFYFRHLFTTTYAIFIYLVAFLLPVFIIYILNNMPQNPLRRIFLMFFSLLGVIFAGRYFNPLGWINERFYYLKYTVHRRGYFLENIHGIKSGFPLYSEIYYVWDIVSQFLLFLTFLIFISKNEFIKKLVNFYSIYIVVYLVLLNVSVKIYDRYLIPLFVITLLFMLSQTRGINKVGGTIILFFILLLGFYTYNFSAEYIKVNNYIWTRAEEIVKVEHIQPSTIVATDAWRYHYPSDSRDELYKFTYDSPENDDNYSKNDLVEVYRYDFPLSFFENRVIYLYKNPNEQR